MLKAQFLNEKINHLHTSTHSELLLTLRTRTFFKKSFEKTLAILLYWFTAQTSTLRRQTFGWLYVKCSIESNELGFFSKNNRKWPKIVKTKVARKNAKRRHSEAKG